MAGRRDRRGGRSRAAARAGSAAHADAQRQPPTPEQAWGRLLGWLALGSRTERQVTERLGRWGVAADDREQLVERLRQAGLVDDETYAHTYATELAGKGIVGPAMRARLLARGVPPELAAAACERAAPEDGLEAARRVAVRRARALPPGAAGRRRLIAYLRRRGFRLPEAVAAAKDAIPGDADDHGEW